MRLGELLVLEGLVTTQQVETALSCQVLHGGRLGSIFLELNIITMETLALALSRLYGRPPVLEEHFDQIDPTLVAKLTPTLAANWQVVPLWYTCAEPLQIAVAAVEPLTIEAREELRTIYQAEILEAVTPEMRLYYWLEKLYDIKRQNRFKRPKEEPIQPSDSTDPLKIPRGFIESLEDKELNTSGGELARIAVKRVAVPINAISETSIDFSDWKACLRTVRQSTGREKLAEHVSQVLLRGFSNTFTSSLLLMVKERLAIGWKGLINGEENSSVDALAIPLSGHSMFTSPYNSREIYCGPPVSPSIIDHRLWRFLGCTPVELAIIPVIVLDEVACILYVQSNEPIYQEVLESLDELSRSISSTLTRLIRGANR